MFGENLMLGAKTVSVDKKGRIFLPAKMTKCDEGDRLYLFLDKDHDCIIIQSEKTVQQLGQKYIDADPAYRNSELEKIGDYLLSCIATPQADCQGRVLLGRDACCELGITNQALVVGCYDEIRIYRDEETYKTSIRPKTETTGIQLKK